MDGSPVRTVPQSVEAEQMLLGALLLDAERLDTLGPLSREAFYDPVHADLFSTICKKRAAGELVSPVALRLWSENHPGFKEIGGPAYLVRLAGASVSPGQARHYADLLREVEAKRRLCVAMDAAREAIADDMESASVIAARLEAGLMEVQTSSDRDKPVSFLKATTSAVEQSVAAQRGEDSGGVETGIPRLDRILTKMQAGDLIVLGGRPSMGKTAIALSIAMHQARNNRGVCFTSAEMVPEALVRRAISEETAMGAPGGAVTYKSIGSGDYTAEQGASVVAAAKRVAELPAYILPPTARDLGAVLAGIRRTKALLGEKVGLRLIVVDYIQLLNIEGRSRNEEVGKITGALKAIGAEMGCPVLALSQLSRQVESRDNKRPMLSDLRDSGSVEQDADAVLFAYRDEYYLERMEPDTGDIAKHDSWREAMDRARNRAEIIVAKQRQGAIGTAHIRMNPALNLIWDEAQ